MFGTAAQIGCFNAMISGVSIAAVAAIGVMCLVGAKCKNLYEALVYLRDNIGAGAPAALTGRMDALIATLFNDGKMAARYSPPA